MLTVHIAEQASFEQWVIADETGRIVALSPFQELKGSESAAQSRQLAHQLAASETLVTALHVALNTLKHCAEQPELYLSPDAEDGQTTTLREVIAYLAGELALLSQSSSSQHNTEEPSCDNA